MRRNTTGNTFQAKREVVYQTTLYKISRLPKLSARGGRFFPPFRTHEITVITDFTRFPHNGISLHWYYAFSCNDIGRWMTPNAFRTFFTVDFYVQSLLSSRLNSTTIRHCSLLRANRDLWIMHNYNSQRSFIHLAEIRLTSLERQMKIVTLAENWVCGKRKYLMVFVWFFD